MATEIEDEEKKGIDAGGGVVNPDGQGAEGGGGGTTGGGEIPVPVRQNRNVRELGDYEAPYSAKDLKRAQKQGRRESRMATAGHIMDTMARLFNYGATVNGGPSAHWANRNQEFDRNTYYAKLKGANDKARQDYWNMRLNAGKADNAEYQTDINLYDKQKKWKDKEDERNQKQPLIDADVENKNADTENKKAQAEWIPRTKQAAIDTEKSKQAKNYSSAAKDNEKARQLRNNGGSGNEKTKKHRLYAGNDKHKYYDNDDEFEQDLKRLADEYNIPLTEDMEEQELVGGYNKGTKKKQVRRSNNDIASDIEHAMREKEKGNGGEDKPQGVNFVNFFQSELSNTPGKGKGDKLY